MKKRHTPPVPISKGFRDQMQSYWENGSRDEAFALFVTRSCPKDQIKYISQIPKLSSKLENLDNISGFQGLLVEMIKSANK